MISRTVMVRFVLLAITPVAIQAQDAEFAATGGVAPAWEVTPVVPDADSVGRVRCEVVGWDPPTYMEMAALREQVEAEQIIAWYHANYQEQRREPEVERFLLEYGECIGEGEFEGFYEKFDERAMSEHADPFIAAVGWGLLERSEKEEVGFLDWGLELFDRAAAVEAGGPPMRMIGLWLTAESILSFYEHERAAEAVERAEQALVRACSLGNLGPVEREYLWRKYIEDRADSKDASVREAWLARLDDADGVDPWILHVSRGTALVNLAWELRGSRFSSETTRDQFKGFERALQEARAEVLTAWNADPRLPHPATEMITITMGGEGLPGQSEYHWLARALAAIRDDARAIDAMERSLLPRWGGNYPAMLDLARSCIRKEFVETTLPLQARYTIKEIIRDTMDRGMPKYIYENAEYARAYIEILEFAVHNSEPANENQFNGFLSRIAVMQIRLGERENAAATLRALGDGFLVGVLPSMYEDELNPHAETLPFFGPTAELAPRAAMADRLGLSSLAQKHWEEVLAVAQASAPDDALLHAALHDRVELMRMRQAFDRGEWVDIPLRADRAGLRFSANTEVQPTDDGAARLLVTYPLSKIFAWVPLDLGVYHEVELMMRPTADVPDSFLFSAVYNAGQTGSRSLDFALFSCMVDPDEGVAGITSGWSVPQDDRFEVSPDEDGWYRVRVEYDGGYIRSEVNGVELPQRIRRDLSGPNPVSPKIGFTISNHGFEPIEIKGFRARVLPKVFETETEE